MVGQIFCEQYPGDRVEKEKVSIFVDKCTVMLFMGVFQGNVKKIFRKSSCWKNYCSSHESKEPFSKPITSNPAASVFCYRNFAEGDVAHFLFFSFFNGLFDSCDDKCTPKWHVFSPGEPTLRCASRCPWGPWTWFFAWLCQVWPIFDYWYHFYNLT